MGYGLALFGIALGMGMLVAAAAYSISRLASAAVESIARQPEAAANIRGTSIILAALIEGFTFLAIIFMLLLGGYAVGTVEGKGYVGEKAPTEPHIVAPEKTPEGAPKAH
jgi:F-type H+-transporting ATPase subunit c